MTSTDSSSNVISSAALKRRRRVAYDKPTLDPSESPHWQSLTHVPGDRLLHDINELKQAWKDDLSVLNDRKVAVQDTGVAAVGKNKDLILPLWSTICGYCEALSTHKDAQKRFRIFPIPIDALRRLVTEEFAPFCQQLTEDIATVEFSAASKRSSTSTDTTSMPISEHRQAVRCVSNAVWKKAQGKAKSTRDELHANSVYVCFRGNIDKRSLDCFGAAVVTIASLHNVLPDASSFSFLTLSEDHAYESHTLSNDALTNGGTTTTTTTAHANMSDRKVYGTCEIALPGNTKEIQQTRGLEVAEALKKVNKRKSTSSCNNMVTPETSWLYMRAHPVICDSIPMTLAAVVGNINCSIVDKQQEASSNSSNNNAFVTSAPLMDIKRELLWVLYDLNHLSKFPFGLMELAECEEHRTTDRGLEWCQVDSLLGIQEPVMAVEKLYLDAMSISRTVYGDAQAYPYFCAGHYHKDAVWEEQPEQNQQQQQGDENDGDNTSTMASLIEQVCYFNPEQEYRLVEAIRLYSEATRVASQYHYDMQLMKHTTKAANLIFNDILTQQEQDDIGQERQRPRTWHREANAVATGTWLVAFLDSLLYWEENCGGTPFCEILSPNHKFGIGKLLQQFSLDVRRKVCSGIFSGKDGKATINNGGSAPSSIAVTEHKLQYFSQPRSKRFQKESPLVLSLEKEKVVIRELELTIPMNTEGGRRSKRSRR